MTYQETLNYIHSVCWMGSRPGLERITELMHKLGNPQDSLAIIHVAGTNGKGSFCAMTEKILSAAGYRVGLFTSPFLWDFRERIVIGGENVEKELLIRCTEQVKAAADTMQDAPTEFELITAIGFLCFAASGCDIVITEAGMGGRLDSTNVISRALLSVITGVALDHTAFLGDTVEKIAVEKAGIIKEGCPVLLGSEITAVRQIVSEIARQRHAEVCVCDRSSLQIERYTPTGTDFSYGTRKGLHLSLAGVYQPKNAALVLTAVELLRRTLTISEEAVRTGLSTVFWQGRFERMHDCPPLYYDGGHNPQGVAACAESVKACLGADRVVILSGVMADKDYAQMIRILAPIADTVFTVTVDNPRSLSAQAYAEAWQAQGVRAQACNSVEEALDEALKTAKKKGMTVLAQGSLYLYAQVRTALSERNDSNTALRPL